MAINTKAYIENYLKIQDKKSQLIPFKLNQPQNRLYDVIKRQSQQQKPIRIIILKARQMGFSTLTEAIGFKNTATRPNYKFGIITHSDDATNNLYAMSKRFYNNLPEPLKPQEKLNNAKELIFDTKDGKGLGSFIRCMTAGSQGVGRGYTYNFLHISELAFWQGNKLATLAGLMQSVPNTPDSVVIIESTANGYDEYKQLWDEAVAGKDDEYGLGGFEPVFFAWWEMDEYSMPYNGFKLTEEEEKLKERYNLTNDQLTWRRWCIKNNCNGDINMFHQEYPSCPEEAFIYTGQNYFDKELILERMAQIEGLEPLHKGFFDCQVGMEEIEDIQWLDHKDGYIKIFEEPKIGYPYVLAGDPAGEGSDFFTAQVIDNTNGHQVAVLKTAIDEDLYASQLYCLGKYYNWAMIGIETNITKYSTILLQNWGYPELYQRDKEDTFTGMKIKAYGFKTTRGNRLSILAEFARTFREDISIINDYDTLDEMMTFIKNDSGRPEAMLGHHDDLVMACAIAYTIRKDQDATIDENRSKKTLTWEEIKNRVIFGIGKDEGEEDKYIEWE